jgi:diguanylate cyclase (GGDEF)-like protein
MSKIQRDKKSKILKRVLLLASWGILLVIFVIDYVIHYRMNLFILYLIPILFVTYKDGVRHGLGVSASGAALWLIADLNSGYRYAYLFLPYWNALTRLVLFAGGVYLLHLWKQSNTLARIDSLTGLANRGSFKEALDVEIKRSNRYARPFSISFIDLDDLKSVNDQLGHKVGDKMIVQLAEAIRDTLRNADVAARLGGDEFALLLPETGEAGAEIVLERIQNRLKDFPKPHPEMFLTISAGISTFMNGVGSVDAAIQSADQLMYQAKRSGKDCIRKEVYLEKLDNISSIERLDTA